MKPTHSSLRLFMAVTMTVSVVSWTLYFNKSGLVTAAETQDSKAPRPPHDAVAEAQESRTVPIERPEQRKTRARSLRHLRRAEGAALFACLREPAQGR